MVGDSPNGKYSFASTQVVTRYYSALNVRLFKQTSRGMGGLKQISID